MNKIGRELTPDELRAAAETCDNESQRELVSLQAEQATLRQELAAIVNRLRKVADRVSMVREAKGCR